MLTTHLQKMATTTTTTTVTTPLLVTSINNVLSVSATNRTLHPTPSTLVTSRSTRLQNWSARHLSNMAKLLDALFPLILSPATQKVSPTLVSPVSRTLPRP